MSRRLLGLMATFAALLTVPLAGTRSTFVPDWTFKGNTLAGWHVLGDADWKAVDGELIGTPKSPDGGWLVLDKSFQDVEVGFDFKCVGACRTGVLLRAEKTPTGMKGVFLSLDEGEVGGYAVTLDANGKDTDARAPAPRRRADARRAIGGGSRRRRPRARGARCAGGAAPARGCAGRRAGRRPRTLALRARTAQPDEPSASSRTTGMTSTSSSTPTSCGPG